MNVWSGSVFSMRDFQNRRLSGSPFRSRGPGSNSKKKSASSASNDRNPLGMILRGRLSESKCTEESETTGAGVTAEAGLEPLEGTGVGEDAGGSAPNAGSNSAATSSRDLPQASIHCAVDRCSSSAGPGKTSSSRTGINRFRLLTARSTSLATCGEPFDAAERSTTHVAQVSIRAGSLRRNSRPAEHRAELAKPAAPSLRAVRTAATPSVCRDRRN